MGAGIGYEREDEWSRAILERRRRRRAEERRRRRVYRRRRLVALAVVATLVAAPLLLGGGDGSDRSATQAVASAPTVAASADGSSPAALPKIETKPAQLVSSFDDPVPILMYHVIAEAPVGAANPGLFVPPDELEQQVRWLARKGFTAVTLSDLFAAWYDGAEIASKPVVLSFDDGTRDHYETAAPILAEAGWPGELDLKVLSLQQHELTDEMVQSMIDAGWELASHTRTHPDLAGLDPETLKTEVVGSRKALQRRFGVAVDFFCYPSGSYDQTVIDAVEAAGYRGATTTNEGAASSDNPYELSRIRIDPGDGAAGLASKLSANGVGV